MRRLLALLAALLAIAFPAFAGEPATDERLVQLRSERSALQARADGAARLTLFQPLRIAGFLTDALSAREGAAGRALDALSPPRREAFTALLSLNDTLKEALAYPGDGARARARQAADRAAKALDALADDHGPLVLQVSPRAVPPRRNGGELALVPQDPPVPPDDAELHLPTAAPPHADKEIPSTVRYAPEFVEAAGEDPAVEIEIAGLRLAGDGPASLSIGGWRGEATVAPERLRFSVPRRAFATDANRTGLSIGLLALRSGGRLVTFDVPFLVLPDRPGSVALDQQLRWTVPESNTLLSPEIMVRAAAGETRSLRRCFNPPEGWRFDKKDRRVVIVERLGWLGDESDPTLNGGTVEFAQDEKPEQVCLIVSAKPVTAGARTATIGRFEATLARDQTQEKSVQSGVRALDWNETLRLPLEPEAVERKLYIRLFGEVVRTFDDPISSDPLPSGLPFLRITREDNMLVLQADPSAGP
ncbi:MAG: hypothetical protein J0J01_15150 [Reyranella sp.]|uniref:hypothetical protein n=1 Tax=Reyranella sp. TaxID=1929291 RepID=UPI001AC6E52B|nr:hypothetical protein [Reyranella sp.]MBN9088245.1 hypothetical protein [Reyranella sp.]